MKNSYLLLYILEKHFLMTSLLDSLRYVHRGQNKYNSVNADTRLAKEEYQSEKETMRAKRYALGESLTKSVSHLFLPALKPYRSSQ